MPDMLENGEDGFKDEEEAVEGNDLAMERVPTADGGASNAGAKQETESEATGPAEEGDGMAMVPAEGEEGGEAQPSPKPPATVSNSYLLVISGFWCCYLLHFSISVLHHKFTTVLVEVRPQS